jgi:hypothetical protein
MRLAVRAAGVLGASYGLVRRVWARRALGPAPARLLGAGVIATGCLLATGCGGSKPKPPSTANTTTTPVTTTAAPGQQELTQTYLAILEPANAALSTFVIKASGWTRKTTNAQATTDAAPLLAAVRQAHGKLLRVEWPASAQANMNELVRAFGVLTADLAALSTLRRLSALSWDSHFTLDASKAGVAAARVRVDLSQPSPSG